MILGRSERISSKKRIVFCLSAAISALSASVSFSGQAPERVTFADETDGEACAQANVQTGSYSLANGTAAQATGLGAVANGGCTRALAQGSSAFGYRAEAKGVNATAVGQHSKAQAQGSLSVGSGALVSANATDAVALGTLAQASNAGSVALGAYSTTSEAVSTKSLVINGVTYQFAGASPNGTVSIGNGSDYMRTITNLAAGRVGSGSTDAVNGSQLNATNEAVTAVNDHFNAFGKNIASTLGGGSGFNEDGSIIAPTYKIGGETFNNIGDSFAAVDDSLTDVRAHLSDISNGGGVKYFHANSTLEDSQALGSNSVAIGPQSNASGENSLAAGNNAVASQQDSTALGNNSLAAANKGDVALGSGSKTSVVTPVSGVTINGDNYTFAGSAPQSAVSVGDVGAERQIQNVAAGRLSSDSTDAVNGSQLDATNQAVSKLDKGLKDVGEVAQNAVTYDLSADGKRSNDLTLHGGDPNAPVTIKNVAAGVADTDGVNVGQLKSITSMSEKYIDEKADQAFQNSKTYADQRSDQTLHDANRYTDQQLSGLTGKIDDVQKEARQAAAVGLAASSLRYDDRPGKLSAAVGGGVWQGEGAFALGLGYTNLDQKVRVNVSAASADHHWGVGAGLSYTFN